MKKVAVLTTHRANNFGAVLQAFALVMAIGELGADGMILDWRCPHYEWLYHRAWRMHRNPVPALKHLLHFLFTERHARKLFADFRSQFPMSEPIDRREELFKLEGLFDSFIVGSDQVWNPLNSAVSPQKFDRTYLLDFVKDGRKKNAYAASIGVDGIRPKSLVPEFVNAWKSFNIITMREYAGANYVGDMIQQPVHTVLDPVLLHEKGFWLQFAKQSTKVRKPYVFLYNVRRSSVLHDQASRYAHEHNVDLVDVLVPGLDSIPLRGKVTMGPCEFLNAINEAKAVFTNSFHASAFSMIFGKLLYLHLRNTGHDPNSRIDTLILNSEVTPKIFASDSDNQILLLDCSTADYTKLRGIRKQSLVLLGKMVN
ncbi:MAG: polysaccharide pyruvyl transferase family protein [Kiritimatiellia bacterium]|jgi:hypothetical protein